MEAGDQQLLQAWTAGDRSAGERLIRRHYRTVLRFFELNASWAADDLAQRTFMACVEYPEKVGSAEVFRAYLLGVARRQLAMYLREVARDRTLASFDAPEPAGRMTRLSTLVARGREQMLALRALAALPRRPQTLLILYYWDGVKTPELAASFEVSESTIRSRLMRARDLLRRSMAKLAYPMPVAQPDEAQLHTLIGSLAAPEVRG